MSELDIALSRLEGVKKISGGYQAHCPCHEDKHQSLSISENDGKLLVYCHAGCSFDVIIKALDLRPVGKNSTPDITNTYDYTDAAGNLLYQVVRYHPKTFKQRRPDGAGGWIWDLKGMKPVLYHLPEVTQAVTDNKLIWVVEGEKDVENLRKAGEVATTISGGAASKWPPEMVTLLHSATCCIIPDNDEPGHKYANYVANLLYGWCASVKVITLDAKDVSAYLEANSVDNLRDILYNTKEYVPGGAVTREEFNELRGFNLYLLKTLRQKSSRKRVSRYD